MLTFGEALLRLSAPSGMRLGTTTSLEVHVAGSEANVAAALAQAGVEVRWVSRLPRSPLGRRVERELAALGVLTDAVQWADESSRVGLFFAEPGSGVRPTGVWYDRRDSAFAGMRTLPQDLVPADGIVHLSGITPALGAGPAALVDGLARRAAQSDALLSIDVNYRARLWPPESARKTLEPLLARADVIFCAERDARAVLGLQGSPDKLLTGLAVLGSSPRLVVLTRAADGCLALESEGRRHTQGAPAVELVDRFGMGDALVAGVLFGVLQDDIELGLRTGVELAAWKASLRGDLLRLEPGEADALPAGVGGQAGVIR